jgi:hypothetical protein
MVSYKMVTRVIYMRTRRKCNYNFTPLYAAKIETKT